MTSPIRALLWAGVLAGSLAIGCAAPTPTESIAWRDRLEQLGYKPGAAVDSIPQFRIDGFKVLDPLRLVLYTGSDRGHLVTMGTPCPGLAFAERIGYSTSGGSLTRFDKLYVLDRQRIELPCVIASLQSLDKVPPPR
jgi:hypothetical protein